MKKMIKRIGGALLALSLAFASLPVSVFAAEVSGSSASTAVTYTAEASYIVTIPSSIDLNETSSLSFSLVSNTTGKNVYIDVDTNSTLTSDGNFYLSSNIDGSQLRCQLSNNGTTISSSACHVARYSFTDGSDMQGGGLDISVLGTPTAAGDYTGTIYFTIYTTTD